MSCRGTPPQKGKKIVEKQQFIKISIDFEKSPLLLHGSRGGATGGAVRHAREARGEARGGGGQRSTRARQGAQRREPQDPLPKPCTIHMSLGTDDTEPFFSRSGSHLGAICRPSGQEKSQTAPEWDQVCSK